jgi:hypothetical protein
VLQHRELPQRLQALAATAGPLEGAVASGSSMAAALLAAIANDQVNAVRTRPVAGVGGWVM